MNIDYFYQFHAYFFRYTKINYTLKHDQAHRIEVPNLISVCAIENYNLTFYDTQGVVVVNDLAEGNTKFFF